MMFSLRALPAGVWLTALVLASGCQWVPKNQFTAAQNQNRMLAEQNKALLAENENLKSHSQKVVGQVIEAEKQLAQLDAEAGVNRRRLANFRQERETMQEQFSGLVRGGLPAGFSGRLAELAQRYPNLNYDPQTGISKLDTDILFDEGEATLKPESEKMLREFARLFQAPDARELKVMVVGHTDNQQVAKKPLREIYPTNWHLSTARSLAVADFLRRNGMPEQNMGVAGFGQHQPLTANSTAMDRHRNRRVEIFVTGPETPIVGWTETIPSLY
jgi:chemotaxis protein MotB